MSNQNDPIKLAVATAITLVSGAIAYTIAFSEKSRGRIKVGDKEFSFETESKEKKEKVIYEEIMKMPKEKVIELYKNLSEEEREEIIEKLSKM